jgi:chemotaxis protein MotB
MSRKTSAPHGAWKVAYADFVTAMMALFMVLWISAQDEKIVIATSQYFQNPYHSPKAMTGGALMFNGKRSKQTENKDASAMKEPEGTKQVEIAFLNSVAAEFYRLVNLDRTMAEKPIDIEVTSDGLRMTLFDRAKQPLFEQNTAEFTDWGKFVMQNLAWLIDRHQFRVTIDGHTRAGLLFVKPDYSSWELSWDRANASRKRLEHFAVDRSKIVRLTGYGDTQPLPKESADAEANQRITLSLMLSSQANFKDSQMVEKPIAAESKPVPKPTT